MKKIEPIYLRNLPNNAHYGFMGTSLKAELDKAPQVVKTALSAVMPQFNVLIAQELKWMQWSEKSAITAQIVDGDHHLDKTVGAIRAQVKASTYSIHPDVVAAAQRIQIVLKNYGNIERQAYLAEIGAATALLVQLQGEANADAVKAGLKSWITELAAALNAFKAVYEQRVDEKTEKPDGTFRECRMEVDAVYAQIVVLLEGGTIGANAAAFIALVDALNIIIESLNAQYRSTKTDLSGCQPEPIPMQSYTGNQVTPTPRVFLPTSKGTIELVDGKDFYFEYKNNVEPGNADCIIQSKGQYRGRKMVTFVIERGL